MIKYDDELYHIGVSKLDGAPGRGSGRYELGSGENPNQHLDGFLRTVREYQKQGYNYTDIGKFMGMSSKEVRERVMIENERDKAAKKSTAIDLKSQNWSNTAIAEYLGVTEGTVRNYLKAKDDAQKKVVDNTAEVLKAATDKNRFIDVGLGANLMIGEGVTKTRFDTALRKLQDEGYKLYDFQVEQLGTGHMTTMKVLGLPDTTKAECLEQRDKIGFITDFMLQDGGRTIRGIEPPVSVDSKRIMIRYADDKNGSGKDKDGVIEIRRGVEDLSLGAAKYAQARIAVDGTHYLKGMAIYSDNIPDGYDIVFNTNKTSDVPKIAPVGSKAVLKELKTTKNGEVDWTNPFGTTLRMMDGQIVGQSHYTDKDGNEKLGAINIVRQEGDWKTWSKTLSSQFLAKQPLALIKQQLKISYDDKEKEFDEYKSLTNPEIKQNLLLSFADDCDASAAHLKAAALPRQSSKVILPLTDIKDNEVYAPTYEDGEQVILIRYPHGGTFEIPLLTVNNKNKEGSAVIGGDAKDAIGISSKVAEQLSGADFDGDTVTVIPIKGQTIKADKPLPQLDGFEPKVLYAVDKSERKIKIDTQKEMGMISNLITDMTIKGAEPSELARAVKHSMVVIDAEKHNLDYKQSFIDNNIAQLKETYQGGAKKGASTLISLSNADVRTDEFKEKTSTKQRTKEEQLWFDSVKDHYKDLNKEDLSRFYKVRNKLDADEYKRYMNGEKIYYKTEGTHVSNFRNRKEQVWLDQHPDYSSLDNAKDREKYLRYEKKMTRAEYDDYMNGERIFTTLANGKTFEKVPSNSENLTTTKRMKLVRDAYELSSGTLQENEYAAYANKLKALANEARKEARSIEPTKVNKEAKIAYAKEVASLNDKIKKAELNAPLERKAQLIANVNYRNLIKDNPAISSDEEGKLKTQTLAAARFRTGANKKQNSIDLTSEEWAAIQAGALSSSRIKDVIKNTNKDKLLSMALPRQKSIIGSAELASIKSMVANGYTIQEISESTGFSTSTISDVIRKED